MNTKFRTAVAVLGCSLPLAACVVAPPGYNPPMTDQPLGTIPFNHPPESANSLPDGALVVAPLTSRAGQLNTVPVGPQVPLSPPQPPPPPYPYYPGYRGYPYYRGY